MHYPRLLLAFVGAGLLLLAGCAGSRPAAERPAAFPTHTVEQIQHHLSATADTLRAFQAKANLSLRSPSQNGTFVTTLRHRRGDSLYMSVSPGLGIEAARVLVTPDSFFVYDRFQKHLLYGSTAYADRHLPIPASAEDAFRAFLGLLAPDSVTAWTLEADDAYYHLEDPLGRRRYVVDPARWRVVRYVEEDARGEVVQDLAFERFDRVDGIYVPRRVVLKRPGDDVEAALYYRDLTLNPATLSFDLGVSRSVKRTLVDEQDVSYSQ